MNQRKNKIKKLLDSGFWILDSKSSRAGQSIAEVLVAVAIGVIFIGAAVSLIVPSLESGAQATRVETGSALGKGLLDNVRAWSEGNWNNMLGLATGSAHEYYLITSSSPFTASSGVESVAVGTTTYSLFFYLTDAYRNAAGGIVTSGGSYDPSTKGVVVGYQWSGVPTDTMSTYLTRNDNFIFYQDDWSGGSGANGPATSVNSQFATSSNIDYSTTTGSLYVAIPGY